MLKYIHKFALPFLYGLMVVFSMYSHQCNDKISNSIDFHSQIAYYTISKFLYNGGMMHVALKTLCIDRQGRII